MSKPKRIQRKRSKGYRMPPGVYVGRPSKWQNPYSIKDYGRVGALKRFKVYLLQKLHDDPTFLEPLRGQDLICWCSPDEDCHGDLLLHYANQEET